MGDNIFFSSVEYILHNSLERVEVSFFLFKIEKQTVGKTERRMVAG